jgi:hypothetical protein
MPELPTLTIKADTPCPSCGKLGAVEIDNVIRRCLDCVTMDLKSGVKDATRSLPEFWVADEKTSIMAARIIDEYHPEASNASICYLFQKKHTKTNGKVRLATCAKQSEQQRFLNGFDYVITIAWDMWTVFEENQRQALMLHELLHISKEGDDVFPDWKIQPHDLEEFAKVVEIFGLWKPDVEAMAEAMERYEQGEARQLGMESYARS